MDPIGFLLVFLCEQRGGPLGEENNDCLNRELPARFIFGTLNLFYILLQHSVLSSASTAYIFSA